MGLRSTDCSCAMAADGSTGGEEDSEPELDSQPVFALCCPSATLGGGRGAAGAAWLADGPTMGASTEVVLSKRCAILWAAR